MADCIQGYKTVCVVGASRGIGLEIVRQFLELPEKPHILIAVCRKPEEAKELNNLQELHKERLRIIKLDITDSESYAEAVKQIDSEVGSHGLSLLINNAGTFNKEMQGIRTLTKRELMRHFETNTVSPLLLTQALLPVVKRSASETCEPAVVFVSSKLGTFYPNIPKNNPYRYSKAALNMAVHCTANELKTEGVFVMAVHPGWVKTDMGGPDAPVTVEESGGGIVNVITHRNESQRGRLTQYDGVIMEW